MSKALGRIPPLWPLTRFVAVNPFVGLTEQPFADACALLQRTVGRVPLQQPDAYLEAWRDGAIRPEDLAAVADETWTPARLLESLEAAQGGLPGEPVATVADLLDADRPHAHWSVFVVEEIAKWCAVAFDENQTTWNSPWRSRGLFAGWREGAVLDRNPEAFGLRGFRSFIASLPAAADECIASCMEMIAPKHIPAAEFLHRQLATVAGWAGHMQYRVHEDALCGRENPALRELLAIRLAYDAALFHAFVRDGVQRAGWLHQVPPASDDATLEALARWQSAHERGYQRELVGLLGRAAVPAETMRRPTVQAVFCIDVRSEVLRRHLEAALPGLATIGFAGFFGFPVAHRRAGEGAASARCPVLLAPPVASGDGVTVEAEAEARVARLRAGAWKAFQNSAISCFSFVESAGLWFATALTGKPGGRSCGCPPAPVLMDVSPEKLADLAEGALRNMGLTANFARLVLVCGHGSRTSNNPYASSLECGACGGHAGDVNARLAAATLNDPAVRRILDGGGITIPNDTVFIAGIHQTVTDEVSLFGETEVPATHADDLAALHDALAKAGAATRRERAAAIGLDGLTDERLLAALGGRTADISQVRPEWGLANNAAFIAAPRARTAGSCLHGRVFLHDYDHASDAGLQVLTMILSAPVVVASWINLQYYASRVDPDHFGSGDKALHHVIGGIGVTEGNGGDLRTGLPLQSIHDGSRFVHEPRRLTVFIEAPRESIDTVLASLPEVRRLFENGWIHLMAIDLGKVFRRTTAGGWQAF